MTMLKIVDSYSLIKRNQTAVVALVMQGDPRIGMVFSHAGSGGKCKVVGYGTGPDKIPANGDKIVSLLFVNVEGTCSYSEGELLTEN